MIMATRQHMAMAILGIVFMVSVLSALALWDGSASARIASVFFISLIAVVGIGVYSGNSGILSFGHVSFMGIGAYASSLLTMPPAIKSATLSQLPLWLKQMQVDLPIALSMAVIFTMAISVVIGMAFNRLEGSAATIATVGLLIVVHGVIIGWKDVTRGAQSFFGVPRDASLWVIAISCVIALLVARLYRDSISGLRLRAGRENPIAGQVSGVNIRRERFIAWVISAGIMALAGGLLAHFLGAFSAKKFYFIDTFLLLSMLIVGGMSTVSGAITGAVVITLVSEILRKLEGGVTILGVDMPLIFGATNIGISLLILWVMFKRPNGITGFQEWEEKICGVLGTGLDSVQKTQQAPVQQWGNPNCDLRAESITKKFSGLTALDSVSITVKTGEILGLIGPNGSGKTTLLNVLSGVLAPTAGRIKNTQQDLTGMPIHRFPAQGIARTFQNIRLFVHLSVYQNVLVSALSVHDKKHVHAVCTDVLGRMNLLPKAGVDAGTLSYGDQRRVEIARALALKPALLFLDEPAAGMNRKETDQLMEILRQIAQQYNIGILLVDHDLKFINALCDRIVVLNEGKLIAEGTPEYIQHNPKVIEAYIGT